MSTSPSIQQSLCQTYQRTNWQHLLHSLFPDGTVRLFVTPQRLAVSQEKVKTTLQLGIIDLADGTTIALLEVETTDQVKLARNRVGLRNFVSTFIDEAGASAVLAVFHQEKSDDWRLTYAARQTTLDEETSAIVTIETAPRRFTFVLGKNEPCRTAAARLATILEKGDELTLPVVEKAFSVETLSKDFFKKYKEHYQAFVTHLLAPFQQAATRKTFEISSLADSEEQEKADKPVRDFVKTLLGRLVFLHFLQKKGWLGCKAGTKAWVGGDPDFLQSLFTLAGSREHASHFHSKYLSPLFFEALNMPERASDIFALTNSRLPYLNGGLFEEDSAALRALDFPQGLFGNLLDFFGEYNFTIDENDPEDHEVGIDPEMLGHIFENLLEDNKDKGAFYTPKAIVSHMVRRSLLHYLQTHLGEVKELEILLNEKDPSNHQDKDSFVAANREHIAKLLDDVKICDPAIGSGAFPIGLMQEILWTRLALQPELNTPAERAKLKRQIIQNSIHGVDIDPGAIEIARLRFWLALIVDEDEPRPLPNLDYKIHRADSLIEYIRGEPVNLGTESPKDHASRDAVEKLIVAKQALFTAQKLTQKRSAWLDLYRALAQLAQAEFTWMRTEQGLFGADSARAALLDRGIRDFRDRIREIDAIRKEKVQLQDSVLGKLRQWFDDPVKPTFLWNLHFGEIFARGGFDIIIANPPYVSAIDHKKSAGEKIRNQIKDRFSVAAGTWDLYIPFYELAVSLLKTRGVFSFITPNKYLSISYGKKLRPFLRQNTRLLSITDVSAITVFEEVSVYPVITISQKEVPLGEYNFIASTPDGPMKNFRREKFSDEKVSSNLLVLLPEEIWGFLLSRKRSALFTILKNSVSLNRIATINATTTASEADSYGRFLRDDETKSWMMVNTGTIDPFVQLWGRRELRHQGASYLKPSLLKAESVVSKNRKDLYSTPKLIFAKMALRFEGFVDADGEYGGLNVNCLFSVKSGWCLQSLVAYLHSGCMSFIYRQFFGGLAMAGGYLPFQSPQLRTLPVPKLGAIDKARLAELAEACAAAAKKNDAVSLAVLEAEINQIVYRLFHLAEEEIAVIESELKP